MNPFAGVHFQQLAVDQLNRDDEYQREPNMARVRAMAAAFDPVQFGVVLVSRRGDGQHYVWDGWHRVCMARELGFDKVPCAVSALDARGEARKFAAQRHRQAPTALELFDSRLFYRDADALAIRGALASNGFEFSKHARRGNEVKSVTTVERVFSQFGADHLTYVFQLFALCWRDGRSPVPGSVIEGMARFLHAHAERLDVNRLVQVLRLFDPVDVQRKGDLLAARAGGGGSGSRSAYHARAIEVLYQQQRQRPGSKLFLVEEQDTDEREAA